MFSPDNFYSMLHNRYASPKTNNIIIVPQFHGEKLLTNFHYTIDTQAKVDLGVGPVSSDFFKFNKIITFDQEPFSPSTLDTYHQRMIRDEKNQKFSYLTKTIPAYMQAALIMRTLGTTIWCHSELNSDEIKNLQEYLFVDCYYWYHGMIARDWFRHWQWFKDLEVSNRSSAPYKFLLYARGKDGTREYRKDLVAKLKKHQSKILYNWAEQDFVGSDFSAKISVDDANSTSIHIVAETLFNDTRLHLTEKIFKPIVMSQPFILVGTPGSLEYLRSYGFFTFNSLWDESYDKEKNHDRRLEMIIDLVDQLALMSDSEFYQLYQKALPIISHNRELFFSEKFQNHLTTEMFSNFDSALLQQQQILSENPGGQWMFCANKWLNQIPDDLLSQSNPVTINIFKNIISSDEKQKILTHYPRIQQWYNSIC